MPTFKVMLRVNGQRVTQVLDAFDVHQACAKAADGFRGMARVSVADTTVQCAGFKYGIRRCRRFSHQDYCHQHRNQQDT